MKKCPFCAEEIQDEAIVCRFCGRELLEPREGKLTDKRQEQKVEGNAPPATEVSPEKAALVIGGAVILAVLFGFFYVSTDGFVFSSGHSQQSEKTAAEERKARYSTPSSTSSRTPGEKTITDDGYVGCISREDVNKLSSFAAQNDRGAFGQFLGIRLSTGRCTRLKAGETVYLMDTTGFLVQVRRKGQTQEYWTPIEAVR